MRPVKSSSIAAIGHDGKSLHVQFVSGDTYRYDGVRESDFNALRSARSIGGHFAKNISSKFRGVKVKP